MANVVHQRWSNYSRLKVLSNTFKFYAEYQLMFEASEKAALNILQTYCKTRNDMPAAFFTKCMLKVVFGSNCEGVNQNPIIVEDQGSYKIYCENQLLVETIDAAEAIFLWVVVHYALNLYLPNSFTAKNRQFLDEFFSL